MGIAIATIAIITRKNGWWLTSVGLGVVGAAIAGVCYGLPLLHL